MKILIAVPTYENIFPDTFKSIYDLKIPEGVETVFEFVRGYDIAAARNNIARRTIAVKADYVLSVDNDVILPEDALINLLSHEEDIVLGYYAHRQNNQFTGKTCLCKLGEFDYTDQYTGDELEELANDGEYLIEVHGGGMGCALIKADLFQQYDYPWYKWTLYPNGGVLSEDLYLCEQCKQLGIPVYADTRVSCGHIFRQPYYV